MVSNRTPAKAFSLIELSLVIVILSIIIAGTLSNSVSSAQNNKAKITNDRIALIYQALGRYLRTNQSLPCPASLIKMKTVASDYGLAFNCSAGPTPAGTDGVYKSSVATELYYGAVPTQTLGLLDEVAEDGWGSKFSYAINYRFTAATDTSSNANALLGFGGTSTSSLITTQGLTTNVFVIISHGANKAGAFDANSTSKITSSSNTDESSNDVGTITVGSANFDATFIASATSSGYDDIIFAKTRDNLVADFQLQWLIPCQGGSGNQLTLYGTNIQWPAGRYNEVVNADTTTLCPVGYRNSVFKATRRCGANGTWAAAVLTPCT